MHYNCVVLCNWQSDWRMGCVGQSGSSASQREVSTSQWHLYSWRHYTRESYCRWTNSEKRLMKKLCALANRIWKAVTCSSSCVEVDVWVPTSSFFTIWPYRWSRAWLYRSGSLLDHVVWRTRRCGYKHHLHCDIARLFRRLQLYKPARVITPSLFPNSWQ